MNLGGWLIWISLMECLDYVRCVCKVFRQFPTRGIGGVVKTTTRIISCLSDKGSPSMKSIKIESQGLSLIRRKQWGLKGL